MTREDMEQTFHRFQRVELTDEGIIARVCRQRFGTVTAMSAPGSVCGDRLLVLPDGMRTARRYLPDHWRPIDLAELRRAASVDRRGSR